MRPLYVSKVKPGEEWYDTLIHTRTLGEKDLSLALELGTELGVDLPLAALAIGARGPLPLLRLPADAVAVSPARRSGMRLERDGTTLQVLEEGETFGYTSLITRKVTLDALEMQFYRALLREEALSGRVGAGGQRHRYARSCGDTSSATPQDLVALHAAIASRNSFASSGRPSRWGRLSAPDIATC